MAQQQQQRRQQTSNRGGGSDMPPERKPPQPADLSYPEIAGEYGIDKALWHGLRNLYPTGAPESLVMVAEYCKVRGLDPLKKPVHIVPMWNKGVGAMVDVIMPGIQELRTTAMRTGLYAGQEPAVLGPMIDVPVTNASDAPANVNTIRVPESVTITLYKLVQTKPGEFLKASFTHTEYFLEAVAREKNGRINDMWQKRPIGQLTKCAEAGDLRKAFPDELGGEYAAEEMEGREIGSDTPSVTVLDAHGASGIPEPEAEPAQGAAQVAVAAEAEVVHTPAPEPATDATVEGAHEAAEAPKPEAQKRRERRVAQQVEKAKPAEVADDDRTQAIPREVVEQAKAEAAKTPPPTGELLPFKIDLPEGAGRVLAVELGKRNLTPAQLLAKMSQDITIGNINQALGILKSWDA